MPKFTGWVPTITGNLSFSTIGLGRTPRKLFKCFRAIPNKHFVVVSQKRRVTDAIFGRFGDFLNSWLSREGYTVYIFFGESLSTTKFSQLTGPCIELSPADYSRHKHLFANLECAVEDSEFEQCFIKLSQYFCELVEIGKAGAATISLDRNGRIDIEPEAVQGKTDEEIGSLASQIFFFFRDIAHVHQHHSDSADTILDITEYSGDRDGWKRQVLYSLYRWVIQQKRAKNLGAYYSASGVLAYAQAFELLHCQNQKKSPVYLREAAQKSLEIASQQCQLHESVWENFTKKVGTVLIPLLAFAIALLAPIYSEPSGDLSYQQELVAEFANFFNRNVLSVFSIVFALGFIITIGVTLREKWVATSFALDALRLAVLLPYWLVQTLALLIMVSSALLAYDFYMASTSPVDVDLRGGDNVEHQSADTPYCGPVCTASQQMRRQGRH